MSFYRQCIKAASQLLENPSVRPITVGPAGIFTELDVIFLAARENGPYDEIQMRLMQREASQAMGWLFRQGRAVRFGPVRPPDHRSDYLRSASKIVYASLKGPRSVRTPNGVFPAFTVDHDEIGKVGRRSGDARDDFIKWESQPVEIREREQAIPHAQAQRNQLIRQRRWTEGLPLRAIAEEFGISHERVRQITSN